MAGQTRLKTSGRSNLQTVDDGTLEISWMGWDNIAIASMCSVVVCTNDCLDLSPRIHLADEVEQTWVIADAEQDSSRFGSGDRILHRYGLALDEVDADPVEFF